MRMERAAQTPRQEPARSLALALSPVAANSAVRPIFRVATERQLQAMCAEILDGGRTSPIVGVTCRPGSRDPALAVNLVCEVVWASVPIYVIEPQQALEMNKLLPDRLGAYNGAVRIWMPGVREHLDPSWHPLIHDTTGVYGEDALRRLAAEFAIKPPGAAELTPEQQALVRVRSPPPPTVASARPARCAVVEETPARGSWPAWLAGCASSATRPAALISQGRPGSAWAARLVIH